MNIMDKEILEKLVEIQSCIIQGRNVKAIMHKNLHFYLNKSSADIITICIDENRKIYMEHIFEENKLFEHNLKEIVFQKKHVNCQSFMSNYTRFFSKNKKYHSINNLHDIFKGVISAKESEEFTNNIHMQEAIIMPLLDIEFENIIGFVTFIFSDKTRIDIEQITDVKNLFQHIIQPLYDHKNSLMFSRCTRVDQHFKLLTLQEKRIVKKVLRGRSYVEIADVLDVSINTVKTHMKHIFNKYEVCSKMELYNKFIDHIL